MTPNWGFWGNLGFVVEEMPLMCLSRAGSGLGVQRRPQKLLHHGLNVAIVWALWLH